MAYISLNKANSNHKTRDANGQATSRYSRYETGMIEGGNRQLMAVIADSAGFDGMGFNAAIGSNDDRWHVANVFDRDRRYIDTMVIGGAFDSMHAKQVADSQLHHLGGDNCVIVVNPQFDSLTGDTPNTWSIDAINKLLDNRSQNRGFLPVITAQELNAEAARVTFDAVQWDSMAGVTSHNGSDSALFLDMVRADGHKQLLTPLNLVRELELLGAEEFTFDSLMDKKVRLTLLTDRLYNAMSRAGDADLSVTNVTETKPFKRQGVTNIAFIFDLSDGQKLSIWFHNPDSTPTQLKADDMMISWKWMLNKRDVTAVLSPKQGDNVQLPVLAARIMRVARKNSKRFKVAEARAAALEQELLDAQALVDSKQGEIEQLDTDIAGLNTQIDAAMAAPELVSATVLKNITVNNLKKIAFEYVAAQKNNYMEGSLDYRNIDSKLAGEFAKAVKFAVGDEWLNKQLTDLAKAGRAFDWRPYFKGGMDQFEGVFVREELHTRGNEYKFTEEGRALLLKLLDFNKSQVDTALDEPAITQDDDVADTAPTSNFKVGDRIVWRNEFGEIKGTFRGLIGDRITFISDDDGQMNAPANEIFADNSAPAATTPAINEKKLTAMMEDINDFYENGKKLPDIASPSNNERVIAGWLAELKEADAQTMDFVRPLDVHGLLDGSFEADDEPIYTPADVVDEKVYKTMGAAKANMTKNNLDKRRFEIVEIAGGGFGIKANPLDRDVLRPQIFALIDQGVAAYPDPENVTMIINRNGFDLLGKIVDLTNAKIKELESENIITSAEIKEAVNAHLNVVAPTVEEPAAPASDDDVMPEKLSQMDELNELGRLAPKAGEAIKSDDPDAIEKLEAKLAYHQARAAMMRDANKHLRSGNDDALIAMGFKDKTIAALKEPDYAGRKGFVDYQMSNNNGEIGRVKKRLKSLYSERDADSADSVEAPRRYPPVEYDAGLDDYVAFKDASKKDRWYARHDNRNGEWTVRVDDEYTRGFGEEKIVTVSNVELLIQQFPAFEGLIELINANAEAKERAKFEAEQNAATNEPLNAENVMNSEKMQSLINDLELQPLKRRTNEYGKEVARADSPNKNIASGFFVKLEENKLKSLYYANLKTIESRDKAERDISEIDLFILETRAMHEKYLELTDVNEPTIAAADIANEYNLSDKDFRAYKKGIAQYTPKSIDYYYDEITELKAKLDDNGVDYLGENSFMAAINNGDMQGIKEESLRNRLRLSKVDIEELRDGKVKPASIVGTGYKDGRNVAFAYLAKAILTAEKELEGTPTGFHVDTNLSNYVRYLKQQLKNIGNDKSVNDDARAQTMATINEFAKTHEGFNGFIDASDEAEAAIANKPAGGWVAKIDDDQTVTVFMSLGNGQYTGAYNLSIELAYNDIFDKTQAAADRFGTVNELAGVAAKRATAEELDDLFNTRMDGTGAASKRVLKGKTNKAKTAKGTSIESEFALVDAKFLIASHNAAGTKNPKYPQDLQPRDRARESSIAWVQKTSKALDPESLGRTGRVDTGAPIVGDDLIVESGNGRTIAIKMAYKNGDADGYREWLIENARMFGFTEQQVESYKQPVLVRMRTTDVNRAEFAVEANQDDKLSFTASERAKADSKRISGGMLELFTPSANGEIDSPANRPFVKQFLASLGATEAAQYTDSNGYPTQALIARIKGALFSKAYDDDRLLEMMADQTKPDLQNMLNALTMAAPSFVAAQAVNPSDAQDLAAQVIDGVEKSINDEVKDAIVDATNMIMNANKNNQDVKEYVLQLGLFDEVDDATAELAVFLASNARSAKKMTDYFNAMAKYIEQDAAKRLTLDIFDDPKPISMADVIAYANQTTNTKVETPMTQDMFAEPAAPVVEPAAAPASNDTSALDAKVVEFENTVKAADFNPADFNAEAFIALVEAAANDAALTARIQAISTTYQQKLIAASMAAMTALAGGA